MPKHTPAKRALNKKVKQIKKSKLRKKSKMRKAKK